jgi:hypothetical protein
VKTFGRFAFAFALSGGVAHAQLISNGGNGVTGTSISVSTLTTGVTLQVGGAVSADGRYVTIDADPQFSTLEGLDTFVVTGGSGAGGGGGGGGGIVLGLAVRKVPFRPAQVGNVVFVDRDKTLLSAPVPPFALKDASLKEAVRKVADVTKSNLVLGIRGLQEAGVDVNARQAFSFAGGTTKDALVRLVAQAMPTTDLVITAEDKVITVATRAQADNAVVSKTYFLQDLLANVPRYVAGATDLNTVGKKFGLADKSIDLSRPLDPYDGTSAPAPAPKAAAPARKPAPVSTTITELITSTVRPDIWKVNGGKIGEIAVVGNRVTIRAPQSVHALLEGPSHYNPNQVPVYVGYGQ